MPDPAPHPSESDTAPRRVLITAGPTHEPIDDVRYIANRSSGRVGIAIAEAAARRADHATLLLGPTHRSPADPRVTVHRYRSTADLEALLAKHFPACDLLIMAAAVADYRPKPAPPGTKLRRKDTALTLELEPTPDLLAAISRLRQPHQTLVGFALEPRDRLIASALDKIRRKGLDYIVANPLESMDAETIEATLIASDGTRRDTPPAAATGSAGMDKAAFGAWLLDAVANR